MTSENVRVDWHNIVGMLRTEAGVSLPKKACWIDAYLKYDPAVMDANNQGSVDPGAVQAPPGKCGWLMRCPRNPRGKQWKRITKKTLLDQPAYTITAGDGRKQNVFNWGHEPTYVPCDYHWMDILIKLSLPAIIFIMWVFVFTYVVGWAGLWTVKGTEGSSNILISAKPYARVGGTS
jgi:hypothetical protein